VKAFAGYKRLKIMRIALLVWLAVLICFNAESQSFEHAFSSVGKDDIVTDIQQISDSVYMGVIPCASTSNSVADSIMLFRLNGDGNETGMLFMNNSQYKYSRIWKSIQITNDSAGRIVFYGNIELSDNSRKAYIFCVNRHMQLDWEYTDVAFDSSTYFYEGITDACIDNGQLLFYGVWTNSTSIAPPDSKPFFLRLNYAGAEISTQSIHSMDGRIFGNDRFLLHDNTVFFTNARNKYYKGDRATLQIVDSFEIALDTAFVRGYSVLLSNGNIILLGNSDTIFNLAPLVTASVPTALILDSTGVYKRRIRKFSRLSSEGKAHIEGVTVMQNGDFVIAGHEGFSGGEPKSDWFSLQRFSQEGELVWERYFLFGKRFLSYRIRPCNDGGVIAVGYTYLNGERDGQIYKFDKFGYLNTILPESSPQQIESLHITVFPNPGNDFLFFETLSENMYQIHVFSSKGGRVYAANVNEKTHQIDVRKWPSGVYFVTLLNLIGATVKQVSITIAR
jgi:Secretion system C-terminal sorting domain